MNATQIRRLEKRLLTHLKGVVRKSEYAYLNDRGELQIRSGYKENTNINNLMQRLDFSSAEMNEMTNNGAIRIKNENDPFYFDRWFVVVDESKFPSNVARKIKRLRDKFVKIDGELEKIERLHKKMNLLIDQATFGDEKMALKMIAEFVEECRYE